MNNKKLKKVKTGKNQPKKNVEKIIEVIIIIAIFSIAMIMPIVVSTSQYYITEYGDDVAAVYWGLQHHTNPLDIFSFNDKIGTGYRPIRNAWFFIGYNLWDGEPFYYNLLNGTLVALAMISLYLLGKLLHSRLAGVIAVLLYLILDGTFIMVSKMNFIAFSGEIFFMISAIYFSIRYFKTNKKILGYLAIILSIAAFLSKEPSLLIIPFVNLSYLYYSGKLTKRYVIVCIVPLIYMLVVLFIIAPEVGSGNANLFQRITDNFKFYLDDEITYQFKSVFLIGISLLAAVYYAVSNKLRAEIATCTIFFGFAVLPFFVTQQPVQPTYLIEANLGMVLLIGIVISESTKKFNILTGLLIIGVFTQTLMIPGQINNMQNYNNVIADEQKTFIETIDALKEFPSIISVYYIPSVIRNQYREQLPEHDFQRYLCIRDLCNVKVVNNISESNYLIIPSSIDAYILQKEMPNEKFMILKQIQNGNSYGFILTLLSGK